MNTRNQVRVPAWGKLHAFYYNVSLLVHEHKAAFHILQQLTVSYVISWISSIHTRNSNSLLLYGLETGFREGIHLFLNVGVSFAFLLSRLLWSSSLWTEKVGWVRRNKHWGSDPSSCIPLLRVACLVFLVQFRLSLYYRLRDVTPPVILRKT